MQQQLHHPSQQHHQRANSQQHQQQQGDEFERIKDVASRLLVGERGEDLRNLASMQQEVDRLSNQQHRLALANAQLHQCKSTLDAQQEMDKQKYKLRRELLAENEALLEKMEVCNANAEAATNAVQHLQSLLVDSLAHAWGDGDGIPDLTHLINSTLLSVYGPPSDEDDTPIAAVEKSGRTPEAYGEFSELWKAKMSALRAGTDDLLASGTPDLAIAAVDDCLDLVPQMQHLFPAEFNQSDAPRNTQQPEASLNLLPGFNLFSDAQEQLTAAQAMLSPTSSTARSPTTLHDGGATPKPSPDPTISGLSNSTTPDDQRIRQCLFGSAFADSFTATSFKAMVTGLTVLRNSFIALREQYEQADSDDFHQQWIAVARENPNLLSRALEEYRSAHAELQQSVALQQEDVHGASSSLIIASRFALTEEDMARAREVEWCLEHLKDRNEEKAQDQHEIQRLERELQQAEQEAHELQAKNARLSEECQELQKKADASKAIRAGLENEVLQQDELLSNLRMKNREANAINEELDASNNALLKKLDAIALEAEAIKKEQDAAKQALAEKKLEHETEMQARNEALEKARTTADAAQERVSQLEALNEQLTAKYKKRMDIAKRCGAGFPDVVKAICCHPPSPSSVGGGAASEAGVSTSLENSPPTSTAAEYKALEPDADEMDLIKRLFELPTTTRTNSDSDDDAPTTTTATTTAPSIAPPEEEIENEAGKIMKSVYASVEKKYDRFEKENNKQIMKLHKQEEQAKATVAKLQQDIEATLSETFV